MGMHAQCKLVGSSVRKYSYHSSAELNVCSRKIRQAEVRRIGRAAHAGETRKRKETASLWRGRWVCRQKQSWRARAAPAAGAENGYLYMHSASPTTRPRPPQKLTEVLEALIEKVIFNCRFVTLFAVVGSLSGSMLCFIQGCRFVKDAFFEYVYLILQGVDTGHVIISLVEAIDIYLVATVMLIFGMGVYELFVNTIGLQKKDDDELARVAKNNYTGSNLFGLFQLESRPSWLEIRSLHELKTKVGHVIVMILLVGMFEKSKKVPIGTGVELLCFSASILMSSGCLFLLSKLHVK